MTDKQMYLAECLQALHKEKEMFIIPNIWNAGSAVVFEQQGYKAVATTSAGLAYALGYPDGEDITIDDLATVVSQISKRISIPLSVDFERGYSEDITKVKANAKKLIECGAVGFNIEDGNSDGTLDDLQVMINKIHALNELKQEMGIDFVINARTCTYWLNVADEKTMLAVAIERGNAFKKAGADCIFIPGALDKKTVENLVTAIDAPVNTILNPKYNDIQGLNQIGVSRLSLGSGPVRSMYSYLIEMADEIKLNDCSKMMNHSFNYGVANNYFKEHK